MHAQTLAQARAERDKLRRQCMVGYAIFHQDHAWDGHLYQRLHCAEAGLSKKHDGSEIVLVHTTGALYHQNGGDRLGIVMTKGGKTHHVQLARAARKRSLKAGRNSNGYRPPRYTGYRHPGYID